MFARRRFRPGTGRGTALAVEGPVEAGLFLSDSNLAQPDPSDLTGHLPVPGRSLGALTRDDEGCSIFFAGCSLSSFRRVACHSADGWSFTPSWQSAFSQLCGWSSGLNLERETNA